MKILIIDSYGEHILDWALRAEADGHAVKWFSDPSNARGRKVGTGLIERVDDFEKWKSWANLVLLTDCNKYMARMDQWRKDGVRVVGASVQAAAWETDRLLGMRILEECGIPCPPYREFSDYDQAIRYVKREDRAFVSKPCGDESDKSLSYVAPTPEALVFMLERWKKRGKMKSSFLLQEKISGIEMGVGGWFGPNSWNRGWEENFEVKKLMAGDLGPNTGEQGTVMRFVRNSKLANRVLKPLTEKLHAMNYVGNLDVNVIIDEHGGVWPLEFTMRLGVPAFQIQQALTDGDRAEWLLDLCDGIDSQPVVYDDVAVGIVMAIPPYPYGRAPDDEVCDIPIYGITDRNQNSIHPSMIKANPLDGGWVTAGDYVLCATGTADTVASARDKALNVLDHLKDTPASPFWRRDIGARLARQIPVLNALGYATGLKYSD